ncbi:hypothetical protein NYE69_28430 [Paenibacillus sp. FSL R5-0527]|uniref:hypothetical protein n=1 Tax=Paenibacillus sp. FSL R5-0527 TaxID=2975321 RepID=UPI00097A2A24|nr:hypothetical protein BK140_10970 [Paenibacillus macerans]
MQMDLDKDDLVSLVRGTSPWYSAMDHPLVQRYGEYYGGHKEGWAWHTERLKGCSEEELLYIYQICKDSWKK